MINIYMIIWRYKVGIIFQFNNSKYCQVVFEELPIKLSGNDWSFAIHFVIIQGDIHIQPLESVIYYRYL